MSALQTLIQNGITGEDIEKSASARLFVEACAAEGIDLEQHSDEDIEAAYNAWLAEQGGEKQASAEEIEEAQAKLAEAEILGRHMAQAFRDELNKEAAEVSPGVFKSLKSMSKSEKKDWGSRVREGKGTSGGFGKGPMASKHNRGSAAKASFEKSQAGRKSTRKEVFGKVRSAASGVAGKVRGLAAKYPRTAKGLAAGAVLGSLGGAYAAGNRKQADDGVFEELAVARAHELAAALDLSGDIPDREYVSELDEALDEAAFGILIENGVISAE